MSKEEEDKDSISVYIVRDEYRSIKRVDVKSSKSVVDIWGNNGFPSATIYVSRIPDFCGGKIIHSYGEYLGFSRLPKKDKKAMRSKLFNVLKDIQVAKLLWTDKVDGFLHTAVTELYPNSEVGSIVKNPNSGSNIIIGEINIKDM